MEKQIENTLDSREVAAMVEKEHAKLLRDIKRYAKQLDEAKIGLVEFFKESEYTDAKGEIRPCYQITKKGCEFIAHKLTGTKGTEFTARYINRFHEMEDMIAEQQAQNRQKQIEQALLDAKNLLEEKEKRIRELETQQTRGYSETWFRHEIQRHAGMIGNMRRLRQIYTIAKHLNEREQGEKNQKQVDTGLVKC